MSEIDDVWKLLADAISEVKTNESTAIIINHKGKIACFGTKGAIATVLINWERENPETMSIVRRLIMNREKVNG